MGRLYLMCGVPGSGKSYWCQNNIPESATYVSRDEVRFSLVKPNEPYFSKENEVFDEFINRIVEGLKYGDVYADATHLNRNSRAKTIMAVKKKGGNPDSIEALVIKCSLDKCIEQNAKRSGRSYVPEDQIEQMFSKFTIPTQNEMINKVWVMEV